MSDDSTSTSGLSLTGGVPLKSQDLAASIVFTVAFALLIPFAIWRVARRETRTWYLFGPSFVLGMRIATYIIRAVMAVQDEGEGAPVGLFIAEQILLLAGLIPLITPLVGLLRSHVRRHWIPVPPAQAGKEQKHANRLAGEGRWLQLAVLVALVLGCVAGAKAGDAMTDVGAANELKRYRYASIGLSIFVLGTSAIVNCVAYVRVDLPTFPTMYLNLMSGLILIPNIYKLVVALHPPSQLGAGTKTAFYLLSALPEWLAVALYYSLNLNSTFALRETSWKDRVKGMMRKGTWPEGWEYVDEEEWERRDGGAQVEMGSRTSSGSSRWWQKA
ncbi:hypothetical protein JCM8097_001725 [Rhodosporidiobolus ruineniae]